MERLEATVAGRGARVSTCTFPKHSAQKRHPLIDRHPLLDPWLRDASSLRPRHGGNTGLLIIRKFAGILVSLAEVVATILQSFTLGKRTCCYAVCGSLEEASARSDHQSLLIVKCHFLFIGGQYVAPAAGSRARVLQFLKFRHL